MRVPLKKEKGDDEYARLYEGLGALLVVNNFPMDYSDNTMNIERLDEATPSPMTALCL